MNYNVSVLKESLKDTNMILFVGEQDALSQPKDVEKLLPLLPEDKFKVVNVQDYNHLDYMWAQDIDEKINKEFLNFINQY